MEYDYCILKGNCKKDVCPNICFTYEHLYSTLRNSNIPKEQWPMIHMIIPSKDEDVYNRLKEAKNNISDLGQTNTNMYIWSKNYLNGKSTWLFRLLKCYLINWTEYSFDYPLAYYTTINEMKNKYSNQVDKKDEFELYKQNLLSCELLGIDNIDLIINEDKLQTFLASILEERFTKERANIFTSHLSDDSFSQNCNNKFLVSRVIDLSKKQNHIYNLQADYNDIG